MQSSNEQPANLLEAIRRPRVLVAILLIADLAILLGLWWLGFFSPRTPDQFDGQSAYAHVTAQMEFGPRVTGSAASLAAGDYISGQLEDLGWQAEFQPFVYRDTPVRNILAKANVGKEPIIILGAHYDSRRRADRDPERPSDPVPGANDGASGVAVLLELARSLDRSQIPHEIWLAFFDAEDNGGLDGWDWIAGSTHMAEHLTVQPQMMILVDMVGDADQTLYFDSNSDAALSAQVWATAARLGYGAQFIPLPKWTMLDDHVPFARRGIPSIDIIDFDYPYWHTTADTADKVSAASLERVGRTLETFLEALGR